MGKINTFVCKHILYEPLGRTDLQQQFAYRELFRNHLDKDDVHCIRDAINQELVLGRDDFKEKIANMTKRHVKPTPMVRPKIEDETGVYIVF